MNEGVDLVARTELIVLNLLLQWLLISSQLRFSENQYVTLTMQVTNTVTLACFNFSECSNSNINSLSLQSNDYSTIRFNSFCLYFSHRLFRKKLLVLLQHILYIFLVSCCISIYMLTHSAFWCTIFAKNYTVIVPCPLVIKLDLPSLLQLVVSWV